MRDDQGDTEPTVQGIDWFLAVNGERASRQAGYVSDAFRLLMRARDRIAELEAERGAEET